jgi:hypothetical protein
MVENRPTQICDERSSVENDNDFAPVEERRNPADHVVDRVLEEGEDQCAAA